MDDPLDYFHNMREIGKKVNGRCSNSHHKEERDTVILPPLPKNFATKKRLSLSFSLHFTYPLANRL
jgi:hypothetical protein